MASCTPSRDREKAPGHLCPLLPLRQALPEPYFWPHGWDRARPRASPAQLSSTGTSPWTQHVGLHVPAPRVWSLLSPCDADFFYSVSGCAGAPRQDSKRFASGGKLSQSSSTLCPAPAKATRCSENRQGPVLLPRSPSTWIWSYARHSFPLFLCLGTGTTLQHPRDTHCQRTCREGACPRHWGRNAVFPGDAEPPEPDAE